MCVVLRGVAAQLAAMTKLRRITTEALEGGAALRRRACGGLRDVEREQRSQLATLIRQVRATPPRTHASNANES